MYLIRFIPTEGGPKKKVLFFEDQGEASYLSQNFSSPLFDLTRFLFANLRTQFKYQNEVTASLSQYRTRSGSHIPLVITLGEKKIGVVPMVEENPHPKLIGTANSFLRRFPGASVVFTHLGKKDLVIHPFMRIIPVGQLV